MRHVTQSCTPLCYCGLGLHCLSNNQMWPRSPLGWKQRLNHGVAEILKFSAKFIDVAKRSVMTTLPPELIRLVARVAHPIPARKLKLLNHFLESLISKLDLEIGEARYRIITSSPKLCLYWAARNGLSQITTLLLLSFSQIPQNDAGPEFQQKRNQVGMAITDCYP